MIEHSPYEKTDQQFNDLPVPDEEASWQKMKELLDDDDDNIVPPPVFLKSCLGWSILLLAGLTIAWLMVRPEKWWKETSNANSTSPSTTNQPHIEESPAKDNNTVSKPNFTKGDIEKKTLSQPLDQKAATRVVPGLKQKKISFPIKLERIQQTKGENVSNKVSVSQNPVLNKKQDNAPNPQKHDLIKEPKELKEVTSKGKQERIDRKNSDSVSINQLPGKTSIDILARDKDNNKTDSTIPVTSKPAATQGDTAQKLNADQSKDSLDRKKTNLKQKKIVFAAGFGEQQLIPIAGQTTVPYSRYGRKSSLADYVPSVFVQLQKERKWFVQTEFRYGAAQSVKEFSYNRNTKYDAINNNVTITTMRLKKTYYHQLPASFNYFLKPNLSVGAGGMYSHFYGAITEKEITTFNAQTQMVSTVKQIIPIKHFTDSFLYKTQVHALLQADYHWKNFSFGLRYTKDIQPYIKYTKPDGTIDEEKNQSLQFMVRYRLWQSRKL